IPPEMEKEVEEERFKLIDLLAGEKGERDYDIIVSNRSRNLIEEKKPEIDLYYEYYYKNFDFLKNVSKDDFYDAIFPFQPKCFEVVRRITSRDLPTARSGIHIIHNVLSNQSVLSSSELIPVSDLLISDSLRKDLNITAYKESYESYQDARVFLDGIDFDEEEKLIADRIIKTLFLYHIAYKDYPKYISLHDLTEMVLASSDILTKQDLVESVLKTLRREVPQIQYTKEKGAIFTPTKRPIANYSQIFNEIKRKLKDETSKIQNGWENALFLTASEAYGKSGLFADYKIDDSSSRSFEYDKLEYPGKITIANRWHHEYGNPLKDNTHFHIIVLTKNIEVNLDDLKDSRIAVCVPSNLTESAKNSSLEYLAIQDMELQYKDKTGSDAEKCRDWIKDKKKSVLNELLNKQIGIYKAGKIYTRDSLAIDEKTVFHSESNKAFESIVDLLLGNAYTIQLIKKDALTRPCKNKDVRNVFKGFFKEKRKSVELSARDNYGVGFGLAKEDKPGVFNPEDNKFFDIFKEQLEENMGEIQVKQLYQYLEKPPFGIPYEHITLQLLCFVRYGNPNVELKLKPSHKLSYLKSNTITSSDIPKIKWKSKIESNFDVLCYSSEVSWNDVLPFAKVINPDLKIATSPEDIDSQNKQLVQSLSSINKDIKNIKNTIKSISSNFKDNVLDYIEKITNAQYYKTFYDNIIEIYKERDIAENSFN
ncbi:MAG: hypothetical protein ACE5J3_05350, partial [Methanosarcinales archaeon]